MRTKKCVMLEVSMKGLVNSMAQKRGHFRVKVSLVSVSDITKCNIVCESFLEVRKILQAIRPKVMSLKDGNNVGLVLPWGFFVCIRLIH